MFDEGSGLSQGSECPVTNFSPVGPRKLFLGRCLGAYVNDEKGVEGVSLDTGKWSTENVRSFFIGLPGLPKFKRD